MGHTVYPIRGQNAANIVSMVEERYDTLAAKLSDKTMVLILDGNSEHVAHV